MKTKQMIKAGCVLTLLAGQGVAWAEVEFKPFGNAAEKPAVDTATARRAKAAEDQLKAERQRTAELERQLREAQRTREASPPLSAPSYAALSVFQDKLSDGTPGPEMVVIGPGKFMMGSTAEEQAKVVAEGMPKGLADRENPRHEVKVERRFALGRYEVSRGEFGKFVAASGYKTEAESGGGCYAWTGEKWEKQADKNWRSPGFSQTESHAVVCVSWNDAQAYVKWLNGQAGTGKAYRLPSEAEWEYAARAGQGGQRYPWGDDADYREICKWVNGADGTAKEKVPGATNWAVAQCTDGHAYTAPGNALKPNAFGLYNMHGNAFEWVEDVFHARYEGAPSDGSAWTVGGDQGRRVLRGGSWVMSPRDLRSAIRDDNSPVYRDLYSGFRLAKTLP